MKNASSRISYKRFRVSSRFLCSLNVKNNKFLQIIFLLIRHIIYIHFIIPNFYLRSRFRVLVETSLSSYHEPVPCCVSRVRFDRAENPGESFQLNYEAKKLLNPPCLEEFESFAIFH